MNQLSIISEQNASIKMSSREIAELCEKRHDNVKRTIDMLAEKGVIAFPQFEEKATNGRPSLDYIFVGEKGKRDTYVVVAQLSPEFTARLVDRWQELENQQKNTALLPQNYLQALEALVEKERQNQALALENKDLKPKAAFVEHYVEVGTSKSLRETSKILNMPEKAMIIRLIEDKALYRQSGNLLPYADKQQQGLFTVKTGTTDHDHNYTQTRVTGKGIEWIAQRYASELML
ncbi:phage antirepressor KilAC domain-containing protein [Avibacterium sp. 21-599]|uniref:phage antirepressor KilAC domain-containing protein n=1 Tax=Avibacterium sp. 21-599 TaxID=2911528 RepID=UPI00224855C8|nr:phage antirepressor KilAC domain-containing protein [Avibacterium sp. 21-599]MCW9717364.1 phage antirepressor KilAC domain-containing protein [Avibacterium sp. 21-599]